MMRTAFGLSLLMVLAFGAVGGCSSKSVKDTNTTSGKVCDTYCNELNGCDSSQSIAACQANCEGQLDSDKLGSAFSSYVNKCLSDKDCKAYNDQAALGDCTNEAIAAGEESGAGSSFCSDLSSKLAECELAMTSSITATDCNGRIKKYNDGAIAQAAACLEGDCATVVSCVNGAIPPAGSGAGGSGNTGGTGNTAGTSNTAGTGVVVGGTGTGGAGTSGTGGTAGGPACPVVCLDAATAQYCDSAGVMQTVNCTEEFAVDGLISNGCLSDATGDGCTIDDLADMACADGAGPAAFCLGLTEDEVLDLYVGCFHDMNDAHTVVPCYTDFVMGTEEMPEIDCTAADAACLPM